MRVVDIMLALPSLLLALVLVAVFGPSIGNAALALTFAALPHYVRLTRAAVLVEVNRDYVTASRVAGAGAMRQMFVNILPNCLAPLIVQASLGFSNAILDMAALGFLGWAHSRLRRNGAPCSLTFCSLPKAPGGS
jgi:dipeptide transport system permease protein